MTPKRMKRLMKLMNWYPPYIGAGIKVKSVNDSATRYEIIMKHRWYNRNIYGSHFGGSLYSMCDPWYVFAVAAYFGDDYIIWDKSASIRYLKPGKGTMKAVFEISPEKLSEMKREVDEAGKKTYHFSTYIYDTSGMEVAEVEKEIYIRKKS